MRSSKWTTEQIVGFVQEAEAETPVTETCRRIGLSNLTCYRWRKQHGGSHASAAKRLRQLEEENRQLMRVVADQALNLRALKDLAVTSDQLRTEVT